MVNVPYVPVAPPAPTDPPEIAETVSVCPSASVSLFSTSPVLSPLSLLLLLSDPVTPVEPFVTVNV